MPRSILKGFGAKLLYGYLSIAVQFFIINFEFINDL